MASSPCTDLSKDVFTISNSPARLSNNRQFCNCFPKTIHLKISMSWATQTLLAHAFIFLLFSYEQPKGLMAVTLMPHEILLFLLKQAAQSHCFQGTKNKRRERYLDISSLGDMSGLINYYHDL